VNQNLFLSFKSFAGHKWQCLNIWESKNRMLSRILLSVHYTFMVAPVTYFCSWVLTVDKKPSNICHSRLFCLLPRSKLVFLIKSVMLQSSLTLGHVFFHRALLLIFILLPCPSRCTLFISNLIKVPVIFSLIVIFQFCFCFPYKCYKKFCIHLSHHCQPLRVSTKVSCLITKPSFFFSALL